MKRALAAILIGGFVLMGCGNDIAQEGGASILSEDADKPEEEYEEGAAADVMKAAKEAEAGTEEADTQTAERVMSVFAELPDKFIYASGAGAWATELYLNDDGTFTAQYHDSDMGDTGADYPNGTVYISNYSGRFTEPQMVNAYTYSMSVEYIELEMEEGQEYYEDGKRYVTCDASELSDSGELLVYLPGVMMDDLPEAFISWTTYGDFGAERDFRCYGIYNQIQELAFIGSRYISYEDLQKLDGTFRNEAGDEFVIDIYQESEDMSEAAGGVSFIPQSGEMRYGHVYRIAAGGFEIALPESEVYYFDIVDDDTECTQFVGNEMYSAELGIFTKVQ